MLKELAKLGGIQSHVPITSGDLALRLGLSQQTASRRILDLLRKGYVVRRIGMRRQFLHLAPLGVDALRSEFGEYQTIFSSQPGEIVFRGIVVTGIGEGQYYMSRRGYREAFAKLLAFDPHPGTLNVKLEAEELDKLERLRAQPGLFIPEFTDENRTFGAVKCFPSSIRGAECAVILPLRSHHADVLEVISPHHLRTRLALADADAVEIHVRLEPG